MQSRECAIHSSTATSLRPVSRVHGLCPSTYPEQTSTHRVCVYARALFECAFANRPIYKTHTHTHRHIAYIQLLYRRRAWFGLGLVGAMYACVAYFVAFVHFCRCIHNSMRHIVQWRMETKTLTLTHTAPCVCVCVL